MTEQEWRAAPEPYTLIYHENCRSRRKRRLFCTACFRLVSFCLNWERFGPLAEASERFADDETAWADMLRSRQQFSIGAEIFCFSADNDTETAHLAANGAGGLHRKLTSPRQVISAVSSAFAAHDRDARDERLATINRQILDLAIDIFGNPFRPVAVDPAWRTSDVMLLANGIYDEKAFDRMPILADALQDAGCDSADILNHLRDTTATHVRGCWALDLVLGKE